MMSKEEIRVCQYFKNIPDSDVQKLIRDGKNEFESIHRHLNPEKHSELFHETINKLHWNLKRWYESICNQSDYQIIEGFKYRLITWMLLNQNITIDQLSTGTLDLLKKFDRYYEINKNNQIILK